MKSSRGFIAIFIGLIVALSGSLQAQPKDEKPAEEAPPEPDPSAPKPLSESLTGMAKAEYEAGKVLYSDKDYANAIVKFKKAHELSGDPRLLWNIAVCEKQLRQYSKMIESVRRYRTEAQAMLTPDDLAQADEIVQTVQGFISELEVQVDQKGADIYVDGEKVATTPVVEKVFVDVGKRTITIKKDGYKDISRRIEVVGGDTVRLELRMVKDLHRGKLVVVAGEEDLIWIDGKMVGKGRWEGSLKSGAHNLKVTSVDMQPFQQDVTIEDGKKRRVDVELIPVAKDSTAMILWIVGGVTLAAATAVTAGFLFEPAESPPIEGSINPGSVQLTVGSW